MDLGSVRPRDLEMGACSSQGACWWQRGGMGVRSMTSLPLRMRGAASAPVEPSLWGPFYGDSVFSVKEI